MRKQRRYAVYAMPPPGHPLEIVAAQWLGRNAYSAKPLPPPSVPGLPAEAWRDLVAAPARYGFHATLMAPFIPGRSIDEADILAGFEAIVASREPVLIPALELDRLGDFFALVPAQRLPSLDRLAAAVVVGCQAMRKPLSAAEIARRRKAGLTPVEEANLLTWGYPYVFDAFRFHMTLTGPVPAAGGPKVMDLLRAQFAEFIGKPHFLDHIALCVEPSPDSPLKVLRTAWLISKNATTSR
jgi:hypothetical protein